MSVVSFGPAKETLSAEKLTIELPADVLANLRAEAKNKGRSPEEIAADRVATPYLRARAEAREIMNGRFHSLEEVNAETYAKYGISTDRSQEEIEASAEAAWASIPPEKIAEAERLGLL